MINKVKAKSESGITLVALIITIIILVILAAVTIKSLTNDKLAETAVQGTQNYAAAQTNEMEKLVELDEKLKETVRDLESGITKPTDPSGPEDPDTPTPPAGETPTSEDIGKTVLGYTPTGSSYSTYQDNFDQSGMGATSQSAAQNHTRDTTLTWKLWKVDSNNIYLVSNKATSGKISLQGLVGYNNGVRLLNEVCSNVYSNSTLKSKGSTVRNMRLSDIIGEGETDTIVLKTLTNQNTKYGNHDAMPSGGYTGGAWPKIFTLNENNVSTIASREEGGKNYIAAQSDTASSDKTMQPYSTDWYNNSMNSGSFQNISYYNIIMGDALGNSTYWLSTRHANPESSSYCGFGLECVASWGVSTYGLYNSYDVKQDGSCALRPLVTIPLSSVTVEKTEDGNIKISY